MATGTCFSLTIIGRIGSRQRFRRLALRPGTIASPPSSPRLSRETGRRSSAARTTPLASVLSNSTGFIDVAADAVRATALHQSVTEILGVLRGPGACHPIRDQWFFYQSRVTYH